MNSLCVNSSVVEHVLFVKGQSQKKDISPVIVPICKEKLKSVKNAFFVTHLPQKCCSNSNCRGQASKLLANLVGSGSEGGSDPKRGLHSSLSDPTKTSKVPHSHKPLCRSSQEQLPVRGIASAYGQKCSGTSAKPGLPRVLQPTIFSPKTKQQVEAHPGLEQIKPFSQGGEIQDGNTGNHQDLPSDRGVGHLYRLQGRLLPHSYTGTVQEIPKISCPGPNIPIQGPALWSVHSTFGIHNSSKGSETDGPIQGYKDPPVPRRLVGESHIPPGLSPAYQVIGSDLSGPRLAGKSRKIRTGTQTGLRLCRLSVRPPVRSGPTHIRTLAEPPAESTGTVSPTNLSGPGVHVPNRVANSHRKASSSGTVADFLMYLFQDRKLQPSTIDGYRSAIADKLGNSSSNISKDENLTRLLDSFHRDRPKGRRGIPSWNLSLVLHQLAKAPFEPLKEASLKHLTFKTVFLLALGSGKRRSEIHAWQNKNIRHQADWSKVSLYPSPSFLSKNQLAKEGPESVAPVVIPALAPTLDRSLKSDRSLCPVRALCYYLDRTSDLRQNKELVFISFKKGFDKDISPATISSWIKQTVILCYELSDQESHTLHQVKAHDVRAFAASKAFQSGRPYQPATGNHITPSHSST